MEERFVARTSTSRTLLLVLGSLAFVVGGAWIAGLFGASPRPDREWVGWLALFFFTATSAAGVARLFQERERIVVDQRGFTWRGWSNDHISWDEVTEIKEWRYRRQHMYCLALRHPSHYPATTVFGRIARLNAAVGAAPLTITATGTDRSAAELGEALYRWWPNAGL